MSKNAAKPAPEPSWRENIEKKAAFSVKVRMERMLRERRAKLRLAASLNATNVKTITAYLDRMYAAWVRELPSILPPLARLAIEKASAYDTDTYFMVPLTACSLYVGGSGGCLGNVMHPASKLRDAYGSDLDACMRKLLKADVLAIVKSVLGPRAVASWESNSFVVGVSDAAIVLKVVIGVPSIDEYEGVTDTDDDSSETESSASESASSSSDSSESR